MRDDLFLYIIGGYCYANSIDSWWDLTEAERLNFCKEYIEPYFTVKDVAFFYQNYVL